MTADVLLLAIAGALALFAAGLIVLFAPTPAPDGDPRKRWMDRVREGVLKLT